MARFTTEQRRSRASAVASGFVKEIDMFFQRKDPVHRTMRTLARALEKAQIPYAVVGGMAVFAQGYHRTTQDVDVLLTAEGFAAFRRLFVPKNFRRVPTRPRKFVDAKTGIHVDILVSGLFPGSGEPGPISYPDPEAVTQIIEDIRVVNLANLIQLKLAAQRHQDFADVVNLIAAHNLNESFLKNLHSSVHRDYVECLEEKRRNEEYETRQNRHVQEMLSEEDTQHEES
jgi:hypothetical protein